MLRRQVIQLSPVLPPRDTEPHTKARVALNLPCCLARSARREIQRPDEDALLGRLGRLAGLIRDQAAVGRDACAIDRKVGLHHIDGFRFRRHRQRKQPVPRQLLRVVDQVSSVRRPVSQREPEAGQPEHEFFRARAIGADAVDQLLIDLAEVIGDLASIRRPDESRHEVLRLIGGELDGFARVRVHDPDLSCLLDDRHARAVR